MFWYPGKKAKQERDALLKELNELRQKEKARIAEIKAREEEEARYREAIAQAEKEEQEERAKNEKDKERATKQGRPYFRIIRVEIDPENPNNGAFEFDWNSKFIELLRKQNYTGETEEDTVDQWFTDVCRHVVLETFEQSTADISAGSHINRKDLGDGKFEVS